MGTRHLIAVAIDGEYRVAQYGQWDGYPSGVGKEVLQFLHKWERTLFEDKVRLCRYLTDPEIDAVNRAVSEDGKTLAKDFPQLSRDTSYRILKMIQESEAGLVLKDNIDFAGDSLFCEWAYVIDLDKNTFEVFKGYNGDSVAGERFAGAPVEAGSEYKPVKHAKTYLLGDLPAVSDFLSYLKEVEEA